MSVLPEVYYKQVQETDKAIADLRTEVAVVKNDVSVIKADVQYLRKNKNGEDRHGLIRLLVGALLALAGVGMGWSMFGGKSIGS